MQLVGFVFGDVVFNVDDGEDIVIHKLAKALGKYSSKNAVKTETADDPSSSVNQAVESVNADDVYPEAGVAELQKDHAAEDHATPSRERINSQSQRNSVPIFGHVPNSIGIRVRNL